MCCGLVLVGLGMALYTDLKMAVAYALSLSLVGIGFVLLATMSPGFWLAEWNIPGAATIEAWAFTLYLTHKQMIHMAASVVDDYMEQKLETVALALVFSAGAAAGIHYLIEKPCLAFRDRVLRSSGLTSSATVSTP